MDVDLDIIVIKNSERVSYILGVFSSVLGIIPIIYSSIKLLVLSSIALTISFIAALVNTTNTSENESILQITGMLDALGGVIVAITCSMLVKMHNNIFGCFRILWLLTIATSSCTYSFFARHMTSSVIPNDVTLIVLIASSILLGLSFIIARCRRNQTEEYHEKTTIAEAILICGAIFLRFDEDLEKYTHVSLGIIVWRCACWISSLFAIRFYMIHRRNSADEPT